MAHRANHVTLLRAGPAQGRGPVGPVPAQTQLEIIALLPPSLRRPSLRNNQDPQAIAPQPCGRQKSSLDVATVVDTKFVGLMDVAQLV